MEQTKKKAKTLLEPDYFSDFYCLANNCRNDCCHGWTINVPRPCYVKIRSTRKSTELDALVREAIIRDRKADNKLFFARMKLHDNGDCRFLNEHRLCSLQLECGHSVLPDICRDFPRHAILRDTAVYRACTPACEGVVHLLWARPNGLRFLASEVKSPIRGQIISAPDGKEYLYGRFNEIQSLTIRILQNRAYRLDERVILLGIALRKLSELENAEAEPDVDEWLSHYASFIVGGEYRDTVQKLPKNPQLFIGNNLRTFRAMPSNEVMRKSLDQMLQNLQIREAGLQLTYNLERYEELEHLLWQLLSDNEFLLENVLVNEWFRENYPLTGKYGVWQSYVRFCMLYSLLKFMLTASMTESTTKDDIVQIIVKWSRILLHNRLRADALTEEFHQNNSDTLAHMAILVNG